MAIAESDMMHEQSSRRSLAWLLAAASVVGVVIALWLSFESMVAIWMRDNTFAHGFLIPVLSAYAFWLKRAELRAAAIQPSALALTILLLTSLVWFIGDIAGVQVMHQLAAVAMIGIVVWAVLGHAVAGAALLFQSRTDEIPLHDLEKRSSITARVFQVRDDLETSITHVTKTDSKRELLRPKLFGTLGPNAI